MHVVAYHKSGMCVRFLPWRTGSFAIKGRNSSTLASSDILKQSKVYSRGGRGGASVCLSVGVCVCVDARGGSWHSLTRKWGRSIWNFSRELYLIHYGEAEACLSAIRILAEEMPSKLGSWQSPTFASKNIHITTMCVNQKRVRRTNLSIMWTSATAAPFALTDSTLCMREDAHMAVLQCTINRGDKQRNVWF